MADIAIYLNNIKNAVLGKEVRSSIHDGIKTINNEVESTTQKQSDLNDKQDALNQQFKNLIINAGNSNAEVAASRGSYDYLPDRLNGFDEQFNTILPQPTIFQTSRKAWKDEEKNNQYEAWCSGTTFYDEELDKICLIYNAKSSHTSIDGDVYLRMKSDYGELSKPLVVAKHDETYGKRCHAAGITKEGYYVALVLHYTDSTGNGKLYRYLSTDKGQSWSIKDVLLDGENKLSGESCSVFKTKTGRLLSFNRLSPSPSTGVCIMRSDNNGYDWQYTMINKGTAPNPLEGNFIQLSNGDIYCVVRGNLYTGNFSQKENTYITKSTDNGNTWTTLEVMNDIDATFNPVALLYHEDIKCVEMVYGSRLISSDGYGSLYQRICSEDDFAKGNYGEEIKIMQGGNGADFGYVGIAKSKNNVVNAFYYNGESGSTSIYNMIGTRGSVLTVYDSDSDLNYIDFDESISNTPFTNFSYLKTPVELFHSSTSSITSQITLDCKAKFNNEWFNNNVDGVRLEVILKNIDGNTESINVNFDTDDFTSIPQRRVVCSHTFEINQYIDTFVKPTLKTVNVYINKPAKVQTLIIRAVGLLYKQK